MTNGNKKDIELDYIGKVYDAFKGTSAAIYRTLLMQILFSPIIIALALGIVTVNQDFTVAGLTFVMPSWMVLVGGSWLTAGIFSTLVGLSIYEDRLNRTIRRLYQSLEYTDVSMNATSDLDNAGPFDETAFLGTIFRYWQSVPSKFGTLMLILNLLLVFGLVILLPIIVQLVVFYKLFLLFGSLWWVVTLSILLLLITLSNVFLSVRGLKV